MFDQTSMKVSPHKAFCVLPLQFCSDVTQIGFLIGCFFPLGLALFAKVVNDQTFACEGKGWMNTAVCLIYNVDQTWEAIKMQC